MTGPRARADGDRDGDGEPRPAAGARRAALAVGFAAALALAAVPAAAHVNHATADSQLSPDGTVLVETAFATVDGWLVVRADDGGEPGRALGHARLPSDGFRTDVRVRIDRAAWADWTGARRPWVVLHRDDGDGTFEPDEDEALSSFGSVAGERFALARGDRAVVTGRGFGSQAATDATVGVRRVTLLRSGHLIVHNATDDGLGRVLGHRALGAGTHRGLNVTVDRSFLAARDRVTVRAVAYGDDGDGTFEPGDDAPIRAGNATVGTRLGIEAGAITPAGTATARPTDTTSGTATTPGTAAPASPATPSASPTDEPLVVTASPTPPPTAAPTDPPTATRTTAPGFGLGAAAAAVLALAALALARGGRGGDRP